MWVLIISIYTSHLAHFDAVSLVNVSGFSSQPVCEEAAKQAKLKFDSTTDYTTKTLCLEIK